MTKVLDDTNLGYFISKIKAAFWPKTDVVQIDIDNTPTVDSENLVKSGGVYTALSEKMEQYVIPVYQDSETNNYYIDSSVTYTTINTAISNGKLIYISDDTKNSIIPTTYVIDDGVIQIAGIYGVLGVFAFVFITASANNAPSVMVGSASIPTSLADLADDSTHKTVTDIEKSTWNGKQDAISDLATIRSNASAGAAKVSNVQSDWNATSGLAQILNKPTIPAAQVQSDWNATSGMGVILNKPTIPSTLDQIADGSTRKLNVFLNEGGELTFYGVPHTDGISLIDGYDGAVYALSSYTANGHEDYVLATTDQIPTESTVSGWGFTKNTGTLTSETDPVFTASAAHGISSTDISNWNAKQKAITISSSEPTSSQGSNGDIWIVI